MIAVSEELLTLRRESHRITAEQLARGITLRSQTGESSFMNSRLARYCYNRNSIISRPPMR